MIGDNQVRNTFIKWLKAIYISAVMLTPSIFLIFPDLAFLICLLSPLIVLEYFFLAILVHSLKWNLMIVFSSWLLVAIVNSIDRYFHYNDVTRVLNEYKSDYTLLEAIVLLIIHLAIQAGFVWAVGYRVRKQLTTN